ncbi:MAG: ornithine cyclodeaminase family protein [Vicinamibacterales bacterium]
MILLSETDIRAVLTMPALIDAMAEALGAFSDGRVNQPVRQVLEVGPTRAYYGVMPAATDDPPALGAKLVTVFASNLARGLPSHMATIVLMDPDTGAPVALLDGRYITEARTAAVSAVSVRLLARADASVLAVLGSGVQARSHVEAIRHVRPIREVRVWSRSAANREAFVREVGETTGLVVRAEDAAAAAVADAHVVVLATASHTPVLRSADVAPGTHVVGVGACRPDQREMPTALIQRARVYVDSRAAAFQEAGDLILPVAEGAIDQGHVVGELGELVRGRVAGRLTADEVTLFKSLGMAVEDLTAAALVVSLAGARGIGLPWSPT